MKIEFSKIIIFFSKNSNNASQCIAYIQETQANLLFCICTLFLNIHQSSWQRNINQLGQVEAKIQNITWEDMATKPQEVNAKAIDILNRSHPRFTVLVSQKLKSFPYRIITPADEHAAANDNVAVTCIFQIKEEENLIYVV